MLSSAALFPSLEPAAAEAPAMRTGVVLLVEDEDPLAELLATLLARIKVRVIRAADGAQAVRLFNEHRATIVLALVDCHLPDTGGAELCRTLRETAPGLPLLLTSGRDQRALEAKLAADGPCQFLPKPYMPGDVVRRITSLLPPADGTFV
jgi:Response regulators consisting of a CheY-like receiver domain and a winged-helix DNA-binding domain